uniref:Integrin-alpha FG-GAP repeat-containing protein 2 n=1 Tax=Aceria tosichella TaxID=561515 RepID=A0A6G1SIA3_9ACAR
MREVSFVKRLKFDFNGSVTKRALVIGDADNDAQNELVCANLQGDLAIFKGRNPNRYGYADHLGMVTACAIGDLINSGKNLVAAINMEGWLFIFDVPSTSTTTTRSVPATATTNNDGPHSPNANSLDDTRGLDTVEDASPIEANGERKLVSIYQQRMPANCKELLLADLDGDGQNELIISLTDRVLRTYKWIKIGPSEQGKFVGLYKWEFADQIGSVSLNPSRHENCKDIVVAQPGGTYAKLECFDKKPISSSRSNSHHSEGGDPGDRDEVRTDYVNKLTPEYHQLALSQMRNHHVSTEVLGNIQDGKGSKSCDLIVIATLDGTLMLVNKDEILWSLQVDHQLFALAVLESSRPPKPRGLPQSESTCTIVPSLEYQQSESNVSSTEQKSQYFVACAWNGKTYIIDEERNYLRFKFDEAVSAFTAGNYYFDDSHHACLVYATFNNQIILYYDVLLDSIRPIYLLDEIMNNIEYEDLLGDLHELADKLGLPDGLDEQQQQQTAGDSVQEDNGKTLRLYKAISEILYNLTDEEALSLRKRYD